MECLRCRGMQIVDPSWMKWIIESLQDFDREGMSEDNKNRLDLFLNLLEGLPHGRI